jgi:capsular polysaccharide transport system ATP-binding protein
MITLTNVHKRYWTNRGEPHWVLRGITLTFPSDVNVGILGRNGAGKSTLLRLMAGLDTPTIGTIERTARMSWPLGITKGLQGSLTGRQNARFICRIYGYENEALDERVTFIQSYSELGELFDEPVRTYSAGMRGRLNFAVAQAFRFDMYLADEGMGTGDAVFKKKAKRALRNRFNRSGLILVSHNEATLRAFCDAAVWLHEGKAYWFDSVGKAVRQYKKSLRAPDSMQDAPADTEETAGNVPASC